MTVTNLCFKKFMDEDEINNFRTFLTAKYPPNAFVFFTVGVSMFFDCRELAAIDR